MSLNKFYKYDKNINGDKMKVKEIMNTNIIVSNKNEKVWEVAQKMKEYNIGFLPIIDNSKVIGVITDRDIVITSVSNNNDKNKSIENYINKNVISIDWENDINEALKLMADNQVKRLIVVNNNKVVGIISLADILTTNFHDKTLETIKSIWKIKYNEKMKDAEIDDIYL